MSIKKHHEVLCDHKFTIHKSSHGFYLVPLKVEHFGKQKHDLIMKVDVLQRYNDDKQDIILYVLNDKDFNDWALGSIVFKNWSLKPSTFVMCSERTKSIRKGMHIEMGGYIYFLFDNRYSKFTKKEITFRLEEQWEEKIEPIEFVTTAPPNDRSIEAEVKRLIAEAKLSIDIISPYLDMLFVKEILSKSQDAKIRIITRQMNEFKGKDKERAFKFIKDKLKENHRNSESIHSRIMICDNSAALVSSADLTQDSLVGQFNAGVVITNPPIVRKIRSYFDMVWEHSAE